MCISFSAIFVKLAAVAPSVAAFYRLGIGGLTLLALLLAGGHFRALRHAVAWPAGLCAVFFVGDLLCWHASIARIGPGLATLVGNFQVFFVTTAAAILARRLPRPIFLAGMAVALFGLYLVVGRGFSAQTPTFRQGVGLGLATSLFYAGYILTLKTAVTDRGRAGPMAAMAILSLAGAAILAPVVLAGGETFVLPSGGSLLALLGLGIVGQGVGWAAISFGLSRTRPALWPACCCCCSPPCRMSGTCFFSTSPRERWRSPVWPLALAGIFLGSVRTGHGKT